MKFLTLSILLCSSCVESPCDGIPPFWQNMCIRYDSIGIKETDLIETLQAFNESFARHTPYNHAYIQSILQKNEISFIFSPAELDYYIADGIEIIGLCHTVPGGYIIEIKTENDKLYSTALPHEMMHVYYKEDGIHGHPPDIFWYGCEGAVEKAECQKSTVETAIYNDMILWALENKK
jgi:hypothetical protein